LHNLCHIDFQGRVQEQEKGVTNIMITICQRLRPYKKISFNYICTYVARGRLEIICWQWRAQESKEGGHIITRKLRCWRPQWHNILQFLDETRTRGYSTNDYRIMGDSRQGNKLDNKFALKLQVKNHCWLVSTKETENTPSKGSYSPNMDPGHAYDKVKHINGTLCAQ